jgi:FkbM family methyltransferase
MIRLIRTLRHILDHPLNESAKYAALKRYTRWQIGSRLALGPTVAPFVSGTHLIVSPGMTGATGNIYTGLHEFPDCSFLLHLLRSSDLFIDAGANVGVYTVLASGAVGGRTVTIEPIPLTYANLLANIRINDIADRVVSWNIGLGRTNDTLRFTAELDTRNHIVSESDVNTSTIEVPVRPLDEVLGDEAPTLIKIDVEGWEAEVLAGAETTLQQKSLLGLIIEMNGKGEHLNSNEQGVNDCLTHHGFQPYAYAPFTRRLSRLGSKNRDAPNTIYLKNIDAVQERVMTASPFWVNGRAI